MKQRNETNIDEASIAENLPEQEILIQSVCETMVPKLVAEDIPLLFSLLNDVFPNVQYTRAEMKGLKDEIRKVCSEEYLVCGEGDEQGAAWMEKSCPKQKGKKKYNITPAFEDKKIFLTLFYINVQ
ncbi:hypothetical protein NQ317_014464 [Molorchus minor]|uniref:Dynein heavy chain hydrolytic ATP-binding dynein motor region domain-containing protein n=1 Tax=Molorchus minor TaxID=1323400 RepID=A0ABQ9J8I8_9CUCU|nr:hypothetical protein NQ317_014464 [Molorchus minor]